jgi:hypothetical protein
MAMSMLTIEADDTESKATDSGRTSTGGPANQLAKKEDSWPVGPTMSTRAEAWGASATALEELWPAAPKRDKQSQGKQKHRRSHHKTRLLPN